MYESKHPAQRFADSWSNNNFNGEQIKSHIIDLFNAFGRIPKPDMVNLWCSKLKDHRHKDVGDVVEQLIASEPSFPAIASILSLLSQKRSSEKETLDISNSKKYAEELDQYNKRKADFLKTGTQEQLDKMTKAWCRERMGDAFKDMSGFGLSFRTFERVALADFYLANFKIDRFKKLAKGEELDS